MLEVPTAVESTQLENTPGMDPEYFWQLKTGFSLFTEKKKILNHGFDYLANVAFSMWAPIILCITCKLLYRIVSIAYHILYSKALLSQ